MGAKRARKEEIDKFRRDLNYLLRTKKYLSGEIAGRIGIDATNLSSYRSEKKDPGYEVIKRFYVQFGDELSQATYEILPDSSEVGEPLTAYQVRGKSGENHFHSDPIDSRQSENEFLREQFKILNNAHQKMAEAFQQMAETNQQIAKTNQRIVDANQKIAQRVETLERLIEKKIHS